MDELKDMYDEEPRTQAWKLLRKLQPDFDSVSTVDVIHIDKEVDPDIVPPSSSHRPHSMIQSKKRVYSDQNSVGSSAKDAIDISNLDDSPVANIRVTPNLPKFIKPQSSKPIFQNKKTSISVKDNISPEVVFVKETTVFDRANGFSKSLDS
ncbi:hypothetical protein EJB05_28361, partial [Eragrostis curvula]